MLIIVFFSKTRLWSGVNAWNVSFGEISNLKFKIQKLQMNRRIRGTRGRRTPCQECINLTDDIFKTSFSLFFPRIPRVLRLTQLRSPNELFQLLQYPLVCQMFKAQEVIQ